MNVEFILKIADIIEQQPHVEFGSEGGFNMSTYTHECGSPSCIAGFAAAEASEKEVLFHEYFGQMKFDYPATARVKMGIDEDKADQLFEPGTSAVPWNKITPARAAKVLRHLAETGVVDWNIQ